MGVFNSWSGQVKIRRGEDVAAAVADLAELASPDVECSVEPVEGEECDLLTISGAAYGSYSWVGEVDDAIRALSRFVVEPAEVVSEADEGRGRLYVGPPESEAATASAGVVEDLRAVGFEGLLPADALALVEELLPRLDDAGRRAVAAKVAGSEAP